MKKLLTGNEAVARGCWEAGIHFASAYPGTPSTEILENLATYKEVYAEWAPNEKVALESAIGASIAGARSIATMKHVGVNVAADPLFTFAYTGVNGGMILVSADEPGQHSSQNEQDNRNYAKFAKIAMVEPSDSQEAKEMVRTALEISEKYDTPVLFRMTTRVCHSKSLVDLQEREEIEVKEYVKNPQKYVTVPAHGRALRKKVEERLRKLEDYSNNSPLNKIEWNESKIGVIASGGAYYYAKEVFGDTASYLKIGFSYPLPMKMIKKFCEKLDKVYIIEENDPFMEDQIKAAGINNVIGKEVIPSIGELLPDVLKEAIFGEAPQTLDYDENKVVGRPPTLCAGCPHRGFFYQLGKRKDIMITGDIGCYTLGFAPPYNAMDTVICMGGGVSLGHGAQKVFNMKENNEKRTVGIVGDSTFFHSGVTSLLNITFNRSNAITVILDNRITGMTGHQENPGTGYTLQGMPTTQVNIEQMVKACGIEHVRVINPNDLKEVNETLDWALSLDEPSVIITRWPCILKKFSDHDKAEFGNFIKKCYVDQDVCIGCKKCIGTGCPALSFHNSDNKKERKSSINPAMCVGCKVCLQVCPVKAIKVEGK